MVVLGYGQGIDVFFVCGLIGEAANDAAYEEEKS